MAAGGFKMSLGGLKAKPGLKTAAAKNTTKPKKALLGDDEPDDTNKAQEIAGFDAASGGAIDINGPKEPKGPLVIPSLPNRSWRDEARRKQLERAPHTQQQNGDVVMDEPEKEVVYGLTVPTKPSEEQDSEPAPAPEAMDLDPQDNLTDAQRLEKQALESLLTGKATDTQRVVPAITDEEALANDLAAAPDEPDVASYDAVPIEGFGLAMLRGMGWKDSDGESRKGGAGKAPAEVKRRPALLGIGAKADAAKDVELGEFNSKARGKKGRKDAAEGYNPVSLRNKKTGEVLTEEELKRKLESQEMVGENNGPVEKEERRRDRDADRDRRDDSGRDSGRDRDKDRRRDDRRRDDDYDTDRRRDRDRKSDSRRDKYDSDRRRDRDSDYDTDRRRDAKRRDRDRDRDRSRSPRDDRRRERYRSRSRDSKERRRSRSRSRDRERERERESRGDDEERRRRRKEREGEDRRRDERRRDDRGRDGRERR